MPVTNSKLTISAKELLEQYEREEKALYDFGLKNASVIAKFQEMQNELGKIVEALKLSVRETGKGLDGERFTVRFTPRRSVVYNFTKMAEVANEQELQIIKKRASSVVVDKTSLVKLVEKGLVRIEVERAGFEEIELTPAIMIKEKEQSND
jgi:hypothetical protein